MSHVVHRRHRHKLAWANRIIRSQTSKFSHHLLTKSRCHQLVTEAMADVKITINEDAHFVVELELERLDTLLTSLWSNRDNPRNADSILRVMERKHKLLGIEAPTRIEQTGANGDPIKIQAMANLSRWETKDLETLSKLDNKYRVNDDEPTQSD